MKKKSNILLLTLAMCSSVVFGESAYTCTENNVKGGSSYMVCTSSCGIRIVSGYNPTTGKSWQESRYPDGRYEGVDSRGHLYQGNYNDGSYKNFITGRTCRVEGNLRICTKPQTGE